jgi:hypothetical protein
MLYKKKLDYSCGHIKKRHLSMGFRWNEKNAQGINEKL